MKAAPFVVLAIVVALGGCESRQEAAGSSAIAIVGATIIDGTGAAPILRGTVVVERGRIVAVGPSGDVNIPQGAQIVAAMGHWIIPGMIDLHVHFWESARLGAQPTLVVDLRKVFPWEDEVAWVKQRVPYTLTRDVCAGVTSVAVLGAIGWEYQVRELAERTDAAPRVFVAGGGVRNVPPRDRVPLWDGEEIGYWLEAPGRRGRTDYAISGNEGRLGQGGVRPIAWLFAPGF